ncbi:uncharacterized protein ACLA_073020 [Aspergillus clavatus NRRL 1]|uniref:Uncharacterized protein n=1 Tax=Aspergillus clavatus (strain ATCC 1007 / CBS 513.65 / DSM 816 / NCTC 3887 / NRRL 1 / QM 1276 / 107) TaxID=344612 RepID=A1C796_ASPCL|nr:uncharacterized protein ACLA_073020 [Aspergillus clavatus NRRL 1]EAW14267.1 conserved hypothetical protein [Aspergillus clavatus NRRL 1]
MVKFTTVAIGLTAFLSSFAAASNCKANLDYCGSSLLKKGNYYAQIANELKAKGQSTDPSHIQQSLFHCTGGSNGEIEFLRFCSGGCQDAGKGHSDSC